MVAAAGPMWVVGMRPWRSCGRERARPDVSAAEAYELSRLTAVNPRRGAPATSANTRRDQGGRSAFGDAAGGDDQGAGQPDPLEQR